MLQTILNFQVISKLPRHFRKYIKFNIFCNIYKLKKFCVIKIIVFDVFINILKSSKQISIKLKKILFALQVELCL